MYLERVVRGEERGLGGRVIRAAMWPLSVLYGIGLRIYLLPYDLGIRKRYRLPVPVVCVGNLTFGGTGKTPVVQALCRLLEASERKVVVLSRGHGGNVSGATVVSDGDTLLADSDQAGDEPVLLARSLPGTPVIVGKDRRVTGRLACERFTPDVIVLDDGLQYWQLDRDLDIVVMDARRPFGSGLLMPAGDLREPPRGMRRAGVVVANNADSLDPDAWIALSERIRRLAPEAAVYGSQRAADALFRSSDGDPVGPDWLRGRKVVAFCGIGDPESFVKMLRDVGAAVEQSLVFADHHPYSDADIATINDAAVRCGAEAIVTTEKDLARLGRSSENIKDLYVLGIRVEIEGVQRFAEHVATRIDSANKASAAEKAPH